jgi:pimeloyl-ACP methyl ester carboxylesterase
MSLASELSLSSLFSADVQSRFAEVDGYRTHYLEAGAADAPPLVLLHGGAVSIGWGVDRWYPTVTPLAKQFHVFALDELGHGETDAPRDPQKLANTIVRAEHAMAFIDTVVKKPVHLLGQSQGAMMATYVALVRPDLVAKLIIVDSASASGIETANITENTELLPYYKNLYEPNTRVPRDDMRSREGIRRYMSEFCCDRSAITEAVLDNAVKLSAVWNQRYMAKHRETWKDGKISGIKARGEQYSLRGKHISASVHELACPTLVVWGKQSNKGVDGGVELFKKIPDAEMHIFDKANHFVWLDQPQEFNSLVSWFLRRD